MTRKKKKENLTVEHYIVAFVDMLGQQDKLRQLKDLPDEKDNHQLDDFYKIISETYGSVTQMRKSFNGFFTSFSKVSPDMSTLNKAEKDIAKILKGNEIKFQGFSDSVSIYSSLRDDLNKFPVRSVFGILGAAAATFLECLARGHPIRCGIDIGLGIEIKHKEVYGPALSRAYVLESAVAKYPRIVVGQELHKYLNHIAAIESPDPIILAKKASAIMCLDMLVYDDDEQLIVDYLGDKARKIFNNDVYDKLITMAYKNILNFSDKFESEKNTKVASKYIRLKNYFDQRIPGVVSKIK